MHLTNALLLALPILASAEQPIYQAWFDKAKSYIPANLQQPLANAAKKSAGKHVTVLHQDNFKETLKASPAAKAKKADTEWWIFITGGNKTCFGQCTGVERAWNVSLLPFTYAHTT